MGKVVSHMTISLDGFIADPQDGMAELSGWYEAGTVTVPSAGERWSFTVDERSAQLLRDAPAATGALVCGQRLFDHTKDCFDQNSASTGATVTRSFTASASCRSSVIKASASSWVRATYSASNVSDHPSCSAICHAAF